MAQFFSSSEYSNLITQVENFLRAHFEKRRASITAHSPQLLESMEYSLFNGGKRFRPVLCLFSMQSLGGETAQALAWAAALEMVHTYSLIHDDLPCMDDDDLRRGQPTNHKKFGEALALLAGDALLTESFLVLAQNYSKHKNFPRLTELLATAIGASGMVGGQAMDMGSGQPIDSIEQIQKMHGGKTGALISAAVEGAALLCDCDEKQSAQIKDLGGQIGLAFQIKDDLLDMEDDARSYIHYLGVDGTQKALAQVHQAAEKIIDKMSSGQHLKLFLTANAQREK